MFQSYMVIRLAYKTEKNFTVAFRTEISVLHMSISIQYMYIKLNSIRNKNALSHNLNPKHNCVLFLFLVCQSDEQILLNWANYMLIWIKYICCVWLNFLYYLKCRHKICYSFIMTRLWTGWYCSWLPPGPTYISLLQNGLIGSLANRGSYLMGTGGCVLHFNP